MITLTQAVDGVLYQLHLAPKQIAAVSTAQGNDAGRSRVTLSSGLVFVVVEDAREVVEAIDAPEPARQVTVELHADTHFAQESVKELIEQINRAQSPARPADGGVPA